MCGGRCDHGGRALLHRHRRGNGQCARRHFRPEREDAGARRARDSALVPGTGLRRAIVGRRLERMLPRGQASHERGGRGGGARRGARIRCDLFAGGAGYRGRAGDAEPDGPRRAQYHRVDGSPGGGTGRTHQRNGARSAALRGRTYIAGDAGAEAIVDQGKPAGGLAAGDALLGPAGFSDVPRDGRYDAILMHDNVQVDVFGAQGGRGGRRTVRLAGVVLAADRPGGIPRGRLRANRDTNPAHGRACGRGAHAPGREGAGRAGRDAGWRRDHRRPRRGTRRHWRGSARACADGRNDAAPAGAHRRHLLVPHGRIARSDFRSGRVGALLFGDDSRPVVDGRRSIGDGRPYRSRDLFTSRGARNRKRGEAGG